MKPNWLVFMLRLSTGDTIYVQYLVPTLIMSRQSDQLPKVMSLMLQCPTICIMWFCRPPHRGRATTAPSAC